MYFDYCQLLSQVLRVSQTPMKPTLTFSDGWWFNGVNYKEDKAAAIKAREDYYNPNDLDGVL